MNREEVFSKVKKALVEKLDVEEDQISLDADLRDDLGGSSLELVDLVMDLEKEAKIKIELEELRSIQKVKDVVELIEKKLH
ncbi:MAG TPA: acyl carrier protein [Thermotogota bacterium]|jgi:acyl carrier protein|nr:acyl carrier protein [Thermotogota bacterium]NLZ13768.1 acyl carrier protein [Thermotogaceae bacterium]MDD8041979.1 acyl carrier protein [Thermotogota bacterium]HNR62840.1 acyl carrier protein [Thermotogota bacterium]HNT94847.1 acyl carrier protein [Thermotogota bacterium]